MFFFNFMYYILQNTRLVCLFFQQKVKKKDSSEKVAENWGKNCKSGLKGT